MSPVLNIVKPYLKGRIKRSGEANIITQCPFHDDHTPSFWLNIENGLWLCFSCGLRGSLRTFLKTVGLSRESIDDVMEPVREQINAFKHREEHRRQTTFFRDPFMGNTILPEALLGVYDFKPNLLVEDGFDENLLRRMDIGYDRAADRVTFPLRDLYGNLVGISGRATRPGDNPKYKVYRGSYRNEAGEYITGDFGENFDEEYRGYRIESHRFLWNAHEVYPIVLFDEQGQEPIVVVEGFKACLWLIQSGQETTVALTGSSISEEQNNLLLRMSGNPIVLFLDNDEAGNKGTHKVGKKLIKATENLSVATYPKGYNNSSPDDLSGKEIKRAINGSVDWRIWRR